MRIRHLKNMAWQVVVLLLLSLVLEAGVAVYAEAHGQVADSAETHDQVADSAETHDQVADSAETHDQVADSAGPHDHDADSAEKSHDHAADPLAGSVKITDQEWVTEKRGAYLPLDVTFVDEHGQSVTLGALIDRPTLILPIYFFCPNMCSRTLEDMAVAMNRLNFKAGKDYRAIALSFSDTENADNARRAKQNYLKLLYDGFPADEWKFLTGSAQSIKAVTDALGYRFKRMPDGNFIHPSALITVGEDGKIIRYVYGTFVPGDIDMAIAGAKEGVPALSVKRFLQFCLSYDPDKNKSVFLYVKIAVLAFFAVGVLLLFYFSRKRKAAGTPDN